MDGCVVEECPSARFCLQPFFLPPNWGVIGGVNGAGIGQATGGGTVGEVCENQGYGLNVSPNASKRRGVKDSGGLEGNVESSVVLEARGRRRRKD